MLKSTVKRGLMLDFIPEEIKCVEHINAKRVHKINNLNVQDGDIIYVLTRELRLEDNWAVIFGQELAKRYNKNFKIAVKLQKYSKVQIQLPMKGLSFFARNLELLSIDYEMVETIPDGAGVLIFDFNPLETKQPDNFDCAAFEVDSHNIIPARFISNKQEYSAATLRRKIYSNIAEFLTEYPNNFTPIKNEAYDRLEEFIKNDLDNYAEYKNNPNKDVTSHLSKYLHFGLISAQRIAIEILKSNAKRENIEAFLEELVVRKELADNFCFYNKDFKSLDAAPEWAKITLNEHRNDIRNYIYSLNDFKNGKTHDEVWNKIQIGLIETGRIHGYLRMYWAKKILEWSKTPEEALRIAIYLNDNFALDGNDPNGYVGILWSICGVHDRPFTNRFVTGKIRYISRKKIEAY